MHGDARELAFRADTYVLATGKFFGGGVQMSYDSICEAVFGLPVYYSRHCNPVRLRSEVPLFEGGAMKEEQPWASLGVWVDPRWRPKDETGAPALTNLIACGSIIGGVDFARQNLGMGFMAHSGRQSCALVP